MSKLIFISIKPEFINKILTGSKTIELRKAQPKANKDDIIVLYSTAPIKAVVGICRIEKIIVGSPDFLWKEYQSKCGIDRIRFFEYYKNYSNAIGIELQNVNEFNSYIPLENIKKIWPNFSPPQTFRYLSKTDGLKRYLALTKGF